MTTTRRTPLVSRRQCLQAFAWLGVGVGLAACGGQQAATTSSSAATSSAAAAASTTTATTSAVATSAAASAAASTAASAAAATNNPATGNQTMVFWVQGDPAAKSPFNDNRNQFDQAFEGDNHVTLQLQGVVQRIDEKLLISSAAGNQPDLTMYSSQMVGAHYHAGTLRSTDEYFKMEAESWRNDFDPVSLSAVTATANHQMYGLLQSTHSRLLFYRKDLIPKAPTSWDELVSVAKGLTDQGKGHWGWIYDAEKTWTVEVELGPFVWEQNANLADPATGKAAWANDATVKAIQLHRDALYKDKITPTSVVTGQGYADWPMFDNGQAFMAVNGTYQLPDFKKNAKALWDAGKIWGTPIPWPQGGHSANFANGWAYGIPRLSKQPELAWKWIYTWNTPKAQIANALVEGGAPNLMSAWNDQAFNGDNGIWHQVFFPNLQKNGHPMDNFIFYIEALDALSAAFQNVLLHPEEDVMGQLKQAQDSYNSEYFG